MSKYLGVDSREIKCCNKSETTIEAGISFDCDEGQNILRFHFLDYITKNNGTKVLHQETKSMWLNKENKTQLITALKNIKTK